MKKSICVLIFLLITNSAMAQSQFAPMISKMENSLFGVEYSTQADGARLDRIEKSVYGSVSSESTQNRVNKLKEDLAADLMGSEIAPKEDTFMEDDARVASGGAAAIPKADSSVNYPVVNDLEQHVFKKDYKAQDIITRLNNLEKKTFSQTYNDDLNSRVDRLKTAILPQRNLDDDIQDRIAQADEFYSENLPSQPNYYDSSSMPQRPTYERRSLFGGGDSGRDITVSLGALEKSILKRTYPDDLADNRISRLEGKMFNTRFSEDDSQTRIDRLSSANRAQKTASKYDSNKITQHLGTAVQIGAMILMVLACVL